MNSKPRKITVKGRRRMGAGGRAASREAKQASGRAGYAVMVANLTAKLLMAQQQPLSSVERATGLGNDPVLETENPGPPMIQ